MKYELQKSTPIVYVVLIAIVLCVYWLWEANSPVESLRHERSVVLVYILSAISFPLGYAVLFLFSQLARNFNLPVSDVMLIFGMTAAGYTQWFIVVPWIIKKGAVVERSFRITGIALGRFLFIIANLLALSALAGNAWLWNSRHDVNMFLGMFWFAATFPLGPLVYIAVAWTFAWDSRLLLGAAVAVICVGYWQWFVLVPWLSHRCKRH